MLRVIVTPVDGRNKTEDWQSMHTAPIEDDILVRNERTGQEYECHYAEGGGEDQPRFGPAWFYHNGCMYMEIVTNQCKWKSIKK